MYLQIAEIYVCVGVSIISATKHLIDFKLGRCVSGAPPLQCGLSVGAAYYPQPK